MPISLSRRVESLKPSATLAVAARAAQLRSQGVEVLSFATGEPDFDTPRPIKEAVGKALAEGMTKYGPVPGDVATRKVIAEKLARENSLPDVTADHVVLSAGGKQSVYLICQALLDPDSGSDACEVILPTPAWVSYEPMARLAGGRIVEVQTTAERDFKMTPEQLRRAISPRARLLILCSPSNPCGTMYSPAEIDALARVVEEAAATTAPNLVVLSDEIYEKIVFGGVEFRSIGANRGIAERTVTVNGLSKAYAMTGWRIGYAAGSGEFGRRLARGVATLQSQMTTSIPTFFGPAIRVALTQCSAEVEAMRRAFARRAEIISARMRSIRGVVCPRPTGAFYVFPDISAHFGRCSAGGKPIQSAMDFAGALLDEHHVAVVPGEEFLGSGVRCVRVSFACSEEQIEQGMERLGEFVSGLK